MADLTNDCVCCWVWMGTRDLSVQPRGAGAAARAGAGAGGWLADADDSEPRFPWSRARRLWFRRKEATKECLQIDSKRPENVETWSGQVLVLVLVNLLHYLAS